MFADERPDLPVLLKFPGKREYINIPQQVGTKYYMFGVLLLNDKTGVQVEAIVTKHNRSAPDINLEILQLWVNGKGLPLRWDKLIDVLKAIELRYLAEDIQDGLRL